MKAKLTPTLYTFKAWGFLQRIMLETLALWELNYSFQDPLGGALAVQVVLMCFKPMVTKAASLEGWVALCPSINAKVKKKSACGGKIANCILWAWCFLVNCIVHPVLPFCHNEHPPPACVEEWQPDWVAAESPARIWGRWTVMAGSLRRKTTEASWPRNGSGFGLCWRVNPSTGTATPTWVHPRLLSISESHGSPKGSPVCCCCCRHHNRASVHIQAVNLLSPHLN